MSPTRTASKPPSPARTTIRTLTSAPSHLPLLLLLLPRASAAATSSSSKRPIVVVTPTNKILQIIAIVIGSIITLGILFKVVLRIMICYDDRRVKRRIRVEREERWARGEYTEGERWVRGWLEGREAEREGREAEREGAMIGRPEEAHVKEEKVKDGFWGRFRRTGKEEEKALLESMERGEAGGNSPVVIRTPQQAHTG